jgi:galactokinase
MSRQNYRAKMSRMEGKILMSRKQLKRAHILRNYNEKAISREDAAEALGLSQKNTKQSRCCFTEAMLGEKFGIKKVTQTPWTFFTACFSNSARKSTGKCLTRRESANT